MLIETAKNRGCKKVSLLLLCIVIVLLSSCAKREVVLLPVVADYEVRHVEERKSLKLGVVIGPYGDMFTDAIEPFLAGKGYTVELVYYDDYIKPNIALANNEIDMNMFQHYKHLNNSKMEYDLALSAVTEIPTVSMGIYSSKYKLLQELSKGIKVSIPNDSTNLARALQVLEAAGLVTINPSIDKSKASIKDLSKNPYNIQFILSEAQELVNSLGDYDLSVINGNFALSGGLNPLEALYTETLNEDYINVIAVRTEDLSSQFVSDIIDVVYSQEYRQIILQNEVYKGFQLPRNFFHDGEWGKEE